MTHLDVILGIVFVIIMLGVAAKCNPPKGGCGCRL